MTNITMFSTAVATLNEKELFAAFLEMKLTRFDGFGNKLIAGKASDILRNPGNSGYFLEYATRMADDLEGGEWPEGDLEVLIGDMLEHVKVLEAIRADFRRLKESLGVDLADGSDDLPRYLVPTTVNKQEAA